MPDIKHFVTQSHCCGGQTHNKNIANFWKYVVKESNIDLVDHNFLESGHTYMECDEDFDIIEKAKVRIPYVFVLDYWIEDVKKKSSKNVNVPKIKIEDFISIEAIDSIVNTAMCKDETGRQDKSNGIQFDGRDLTKKKLFLL